MYFPDALTSYTPEEIRAFIVQRLRAALPGLELEQRHGEPYRLTMSHPEAGDLVLNLGNLVHELRSAPPQTAERLVDTYISLAKSAMTPPEIALKSVYPGLRHGAFLDATGQDMSDRIIGEGPGDLVSVILADQGDGLATLNEKAVRAAGFAPEDVLMAAERNFVDLLPRAFRAAVPEEGVLSLGLQNRPWLGTSVLFVPSLISCVMEERGWKRALLASPTRETVDLVNMDRSGATPLMENWMAQNLAGPRTQSEVVFTFSAGETEYRQSHRMFDGRLLRVN